MNVIKYFGVGLLLLAGCGRADHPQAYEVTGAVQLDGRPLASGTVVFMSETGRAAKGAIGRNGSFKMGTYADDDGALAGRYKVMIIAPDAKAMGGKHIRLDQELPSLVPARYTSTTTSGLEFEVATDKPNVARFSLTSKATP